MIRLKAGSLSAIALACPLTLAEPIPVVNPGFEDLTGETIVNEFTFGPLNGWDLYDPDTITGGGMGGTYYIGTLTPQIINPPDYENFPDGAIEGSRVGIAFNFFGSGGGGIYGMQQTLTGQLLQPNTTYTLEVEIGNIASGTALSNEFFELSGFPGYRVELLADNQVVAFDDNSLAGSILDGQWGTSVVTLEVGDDHDQLDGELGIRLINLNEVDPAFPGSNIEVDFDDVRLDATPNPAVLLGDMNGDASVTNTDIAPFVMALTDPTGFATTFPGVDPTQSGDFNDDDLLTEGDIPGFVEALTGGGALTAENSALFIEAGLNVPEPGSLALLGLGGLVLARRRCT